MEYIKSIFRLGPVALLYLFLTFPPADASTVPYKAEGFAKSHNTFTLIQGSERQPWTGSRLSFNSNKFQTFVKDSPDSPIRLQIEGPSPVSLTGYFSTQKKIIIESSGELILEPESKIVASGITLTAKKITHKGRLKAPGGTIKLTADGVVLDHGSVSVASDHGPGGTITINGKDWVSLGGAVDASGNQGGTITVNTGGLSLADAVLAKGKQGPGGVITLNTKRKSWENSTAVLDVSGTTGGTIRHITNQQITTSGKYYATGHTKLGGQIDVSAPVVKLLSGQIDASGQTGGGRIRIGGEYQGGKGQATNEMPNTQTLAVTDATQIRADTLGPEGSGGRIILWSDKKSTLLGSYSTLPGGNSGAGGFIETSSAGKLTFAAKAETGIGNRMGELLLDPHNATIADPNGINQMAILIGAGYAGNNIGSQTLDNEDVFGDSVSLDGMRLAVGADEDDGLGGTCTGCGAVYLYSFTDNTFGGGTLEAIIGSGYTGSKNINVTLDNDDGFGDSVSLDGMRLAVGAFSDDGSGGTCTACGAVYLFEFTDNTFSGGTLEATLGSGYSGGKNLNVILDPADQFGISVSLDGTRLAIGALGDDGVVSCSICGAVYLFSFTDSAFSGGNLEAIIGSGYTGGNNLSVTLDNSDFFGRSVSLDGMRLAVGADGDDGSGGTCSFCGAVYLFSFTDSAFSNGTLEAIIGDGYTGGKNLNVTLDNGDKFGSSLSIDGTRLAVGANTDDGLGGTCTFCGAVYLFSFSSSTFIGGTLEATIGGGYTGGKNLSLALDSSDLFGQSVSLDGTRLAVGAIGDGGFGGSCVNDCGAVYLFTFTDTTFSGGTLETVIGDGYPGGKNLSATLDGGDSFGSSVSLDGTRMAVGARLDDGLTNFCNGCGAVYLYSFTNSRFSGGSLEATIGDGYSGGKNINVNLDINDTFGNSVSLDGTRLAVGAVADDGLTNLCSNCGAVYLFSFTDHAFNGGTQEAIIGDGYTGGKNIDLNLLNTFERFGASVSLDGTRLAVGATGNDGSPATCNACGAVYLYSFTDNTFSGGTQEAIIGNGHSGGKNLSITLGFVDRFGNSVSLDGTRLAVGAFLDDGLGDTCLSCGAVYLISFTDLAFNGGTLETLVGSGYSSGENFSLALQEGDFFGYSISLEDERLAVGAREDDGSDDTCLDCGAVYLFSFTDNIFGGGTLEAILGDGYTGGKNLDVNLDPDDFLGESVSLDGTRLAVGAGEDDGFNNTCSDCGAVYLFQFTMNPGSLQAILGDDYIGEKGLSVTLDSVDNFGQSVSLAGTKLAVGAVADDGSSGTCANCGAVYLYSFTDNEFNGGTLEAIIGNGYSGGKNLNIALDNGDFFGISVALDGTSLAVGASADDGFGDLCSQCGAVYLYSFTDDAFGGGTLESILGSAYSGGKNINVTLDPGDQFGRSISLDGMRLAVGATSDDGLGGTCSGCGAVYLYSFSNSTFSGGTLEAILGDGYTGGENLNVNLQNSDSFGRSVSMVGGRLAVGSSGDDGFDDSCSSCGAVYLFTFSSNSFSGGILQAILGDGYSGGKNIDVSLDNTDFFGTSVSLEVTSLAVGVPGNDGLGNTCFSCGAVYLYSFLDTSFSGGVQEAIIGSGHTGGKNLSAALDISDQFGLSVFLDGTRLAVGVPADDGPDNNCSSCGVVYLYSFTDSTFGGGALEAIVGNGYTGGKNLNVALNADDQFGIALSLDGTQLAVGVRDDGLGAGCTDCGAVYLYSFTDNAFNGGTLEAIIGNGYSGGKNLNIALDDSDFFGISVSLQGMRLAVGAVFDDGSGGTCGNCGAVYLYSFTDRTFNGGALEAIIGEGYAGGKNLSVALDGGDFFGRSVSLEGTRVAVGVDGDDGFGGSCGGCGAAYLFSFMDSTFSSGNQEAIIGDGYFGGKNLNVTLDGGDAFGRSVSLEGTRLAVGASADDGSGGTCLNCGAVYLYSFTDISFGGGIQEAIIGDGYAGGKNLGIALDSSDFFGRSVSLDGTRLAIGATGDDGIGDNCNTCGAVYLYSFVDQLFNGGTTAAIFGDGYAGGKNLDVALDDSDIFGTSVSLKGAYIAVGAPFDDGSGGSCNNCGAVYLFKHNDFIFSSGVDLVENAVFGLQVGLDITLSNTTLAALLSTPTAVTVQANNDLIVDNEIVVDNPGGNGGALTLQAGRSVLINADITTDNGALAVIGNENLAEGVMDSDRDAGNAVITMNGGTTLNTGSGNINIELRPGTGKTNNGCGDVNLETMVGGAITVDVQCNTSTLNVNSPVSGINVRLESDDDIVFAATGDLTTTGAMVVQADSDANSDGGSGGALTMADGTVFNAGSSTITLSADENIILGNVTTTSNSNPAVTISSNSGSIFDAGANEEDVTAPNGGFTASAGLDLGASGNFIEGSVGALDFGGVTGSDFFTNSGTTVAFNSATSGAFEASVAINIPVSLNQENGLTTVDYAVTGGTATGGGIDYTLASGTLTFDTEILTQNISVTIIDDTIDELDETLEITLSNPANAALGGTVVHTFTIIDLDEFLPVVEFDLSNSNGAESVSPVNLEVSLSKGSENLVTVDFAVTGGSATGGGVDYTVPVSGTLMFLPGSTTPEAPISAIINNDLLDESDETLEVTLSNSFNAALGTNLVHTYTIIDDDDISPTVAFDLTSSSGAESVSPASPGVSLSATSANTVTVDFAVTGGSASGGGVDYALANGTLTFNPGSFNPVSPVSASIANDLLNEDDETFILTLSNPTNATLGANMIHTYTIEDDDPLPTVAFDSVSSNGGESISQANFNVSLSEVSGKTVAVDFSVTGGSATGGGVDYTLSNGTLMFNPGSTTPVSPISASIVDDHFDEFDETIIVTLSNPADAILGMNMVHTYTIVDDDPLSNTIDFNGDGWSDLLFEETADGTVGAALLVNSAITSSEDLFQIPPGSPWMVVGTGDFNADEKSDILIFNDVTGDIVMGILDGTTILSGATVVSLGPASPFVPKGMGDFDGDGDAEIVLYDSSTGDLFLLFLDGNVAVSLDLIGKIVTVGNWRLENVGEFNRDGKTDFLIYNTVTGAVSVMEMDGITVLGTTQVTTLNQVEGWTPLDTGDFDGDGDSDLLAKNTAGDTRVTLIEGLVEIGTYNLAPMSPGDLFISAGNYSADKIADLLVLDTLSGDLNTIIQDGTAQTGVNTIINLGPSPAGINFFSGKRFNQP